MVNVKPMELREDQCTCSWTYNFSYQGCKSHNIEEKFISTKEIVELKVRIENLENKLDFYIRYTTALEIRLKELE